ncbi:MAG TPA: hypothetical protein VEB00_12090 [Clostridia bacterium]|nr:hypothetical protein [Clostridia bacterium]
MGESIQHIKMIHNIMHIVSEIVPEKFRGFILLDISESQEKPPKTAEGYRPDLYYCHNDIMVIGEAKTSFDFERKHSKQQYLSYMKACSMFEGTAYLIIAVPWTECRSAKNMLRRMKSNNEFDLNIKVIDDVGQVGLV